MRIAVGATVKDVRKIVFTEGMLPLLSDSPQVLTVSVGVITLGESDDAASLIKRSDDKLYEAKGAGRNCVKA